VDDRAALAMFLAFYKDGGIMSPNVADWIVRTWEERADERMSVKGRVQLMITEWGETESGDVTVTEVATIYQETFEEAQRLLGTQKTTERRKGIDRMSLKSALQIIAALARALADVHTKLRKMIDHTIGHDGYVDRGQLTDVREQLQKSNRIHELKKKDGSLNVGSAKETGHTGIVGFLKDGDYTTLEKTTLESYINEGLKQD
jgi:hypothetical protein